MSIESLKIVADDFSKVFHHSLAKQNLESSPEIMFRMLRSLPVVLMDGVADFAMDTWNGGACEWARNTRPIMNGSLKPPFPQFIFQYKITASYLNKLLGLDNPFGLESDAVEHVTVCGLIEESESWPPDRGIFPKEIEKMEVPEELSQALATGIPISGLVVWTYMFSGSRSWPISQKLVPLYKETGMPIPTRIQNLEWFADYTCSRKGIDKVLMPVDHLPMSEEEKFDTVHPYLHALSYPALLALSLMNCKNVDLVDTQPANRQERRRWEREKAKGELVQYKVLKIKTPGRRKESGSRNLTNSEELRLHLCRGHFKTFTEEKKLFGKYTGRYWWEPQLRGSKSKGVVVKDYEVVPPEGLDNKEV